MSVWVKLKTNSVYFSFFKHKHTNFALGCLVLSSENLEKGVIYGPNFMPHLVGFYLLIMVMEVNGVLVVFGPFHYLDSNL